MMAKNTDAALGASVLVLLGATGDMATSKLLPALQQLHRDGRLPVPTKLICVADDSKGEIRERVEGAIRLSYRREGYSGEVLERLSKAFNEDMSTEYVSGDLRAPNGGSHDTRPKSDTYVQIQNILEAFPESSVTFYCSVPPELYSGIAKELHRHKLVLQESDARVVFEKPFGTSDASTKETVAFLTDFLPGQAILVDHYLYKPMVVKIRNLRERYPELDAIWKAPHVQHVQITVAESEGIGDRGAFYEGVGALLDMVQNHILQLLCVTAMEATPSKAAVATAIQKVLEDDLDSPMLAVAALQEAIARPIPERPQPSEQQRSEKTLGSVQFPEALKKPSPERWIVRGQYEGYRRELHVADGSNVETFVALQVRLDDPRWHGVPFFLRTGKCMSRRTASIGVHFANGDRITFRIQPVPQVVISSGARLSALKRLVADGAAIAEAQDTALRAASEEDDAESYEDDAYNSILIGCLSRDLEYGVTMEWVTASWSFVTQIQDLWKDRGNESPLRVYRSGSNGPVTADRLIRDAGYDWMPLET